MSNSVVITSAVRTAVGSLGKSLKNVSGDSLGSSVISESINKSEIKNDNNINDLINLLKNELKDKISDVIKSDRLTKSPVLLIADEVGMDINMEKLMKMHNQKTPDSKKIMEINTSHPMIKKIANNLKNINHKKAANLLLDQANILDGNVLSNPSGYIENLTELFIN